jgi:hypothetical protein
LVQTSDQPSLISANFSPFTTAEALCASDISPVLILNLQPNTHGGTVKKILLGQLKKRKERRKSNRPLNPKPIGLRRMLFFVLQKEGREGFAGIQLLTPSDSDTDLAVLSLTIRRRRGTRR